MHVYLRLLLIRLAGEGNLYIVGAADKESDTDRTDSIRRHRYSYQTLL
jgi:hypothetical protein